MFKSILLKFNLDSKKDKKVYEEINKHRIKKEYISDLVVKDMDSVNIKDELVAALDEYFSSNNINISNNQIEAEEDKEVTPDNTSINKDALSFLDSMGSLDD